MQRSCCQAYQDPGHSPDTHLETGCEKTASQQMVVVVAAEQAACKSWYRRM